MAMEEVTEVTEMYRFGVQFISLQFFFKNVSLWKDFTRLKRKWRQRDELELMIIT